MKKLISILFIVVVFAACNETKKPADVAQKHSEGAKNIPKDSVGSNNIEVTGWIDDFRNFRQAVYEQDKAKLKTYFKFPIESENGNSILFSIKLTSEELEKRKTKHIDLDLFYEEDFDKYYAKIFDADFIKTIMRIKIADLLKYSQAESPEFTRAGYTYKMLAEYFPDSKLIHLNMSYGNASVDENGEAVSEGEHNLIYIFEIINNKVMIFKTVLIAG